MSENEVLKLLAVRLDDLRSIFAPVVPTSLANLDGWTWNYYQTPERILLTRGAGPTNLLPAPIQGEKGWLITFGAVFSDPMTELSFYCDNWNVTRLSPFFLNVTGSVNANNNIPYCDVYNPASPIGPLYSVTWSPSQPFPYKTQIRVQAQHPVSALTATSQLVVFFLGRNFIRDERQFYESIFIEAQKQTIGQVEVPIRRKQR